MQNFTATAGEALAARRRVKITAASTTTPPQVEYADGDNAGIGITCYAAASGELVAIEPMSAGLHDMVAAGSYAVGAELYAAADGKVDDSGTIKLGARAFTASGGDGEIQSVALAFQPYVAPGP